MPSIYSHIGRHWSGVVHHGPRDTREVFHEGEADVARRRRRGGGRASARGGDPAGLGEALIGAGPVGASPALPPTNGDADA